LQLAGIFIILKQEAVVGVTPEERISGFSREELQINETPPV